MRTEHGESVLQGWVQALDLESRQVGSRIAGRVWTRAGGIVEPGFENTQVAER